MIYFHALLKNSIGVFNYQSVRWRRPTKPFWLGIAKSKRFIVPEKKKLPEIEEAELQKLQKEHEIIIQSLYQFIKIENPLAENNLKMEFEQSVSSSTESVSEILKESQERNEKWNAKSAELREKRLKELAEIQLNKSLSKIERKKQKDKELLVKVEEAVKKEKVKGLSYITLDNLNEAVDKCLNTTVEYNFAIDVAGNKYLGKEVYEKKSNPSPQMTVAD